MTGVPIPYFFGNDNLLLTFFIMNILGISYVFILNGNGILQRIKSFFYYSRNSKPYNNQTHINRFCNLILYLQAVFFFSVLAFAQLQYETDILYLKETYTFWGTYMFVFAICILAKRLLYDFVNSILFTPIQKREWRNSYFFIIQLAGFLLFPLVLAMLIIPRIPIPLYTIYLLITALICLLMLIKRCKKIIFPQKNCYWNILLYLCTLEILPITALVKTIKELNTFLTIIF